MEKTISEQAFEALFLELEKARSPQERREILQRNVKFSEIIDYDEFVDDNWVYDPGVYGGCPEFAYIALKLSGEAGEVSEKVGKAYRDKDGKVDDPLPILKELGDVLYYVTRMAHRFGKTLNDVADINKQKLNDRKMRSVTRGEGDNR